MAKNIKATYCMLSVATLSIGFLCYYYFRDSDLIFHQMFDIQFTHKKLLLSDNFFTNFLQYNICDGLWLLSGILFLRFIWFDNSGTGKRYIIIFISIALLLELLQIMKQFPGTFDIMDIFTMAFFALSEHCINNFFTDQRSRKWVKNG